MLVRLSCRSVVAARQVKSPAGRKQHPPRILCGQDAPQKQLTTRAGQHVWPWTKVTRNSSHWLKPGLERALATVVDVLVVLVDGCWWLLVEAILAQAICSNTILLARVVRISAILSFSVIAFSDLGGASRLAFGGGHCGSSCCEDQDHPHTVGFLRAVRVAASSFAQAVADSRLHRVPHRVVHSRDKADSSDALPNSVRTTAQS